MAFNLLSLLTRPASDASDKDGVHSRGKQDKRREEGCTLRRFLHTRLHWLDEPHEASVDLLLDPRCDNSHSADVNLTSLLQRYWHVADSMSGNSNRQRAALREYHQPPLDFDHRRLGLGISSVSRAGAISCFRYAVCSSRVTSVTVSSARVLSRPSSRTRSTKLPALIRRFQ